MDFTSAMETFAEAWVAANTQTAVTEQQQQMRPTPIEELPTMLSKDQMTEQTNQQVRSLTAPPPTSATTTSPTSVSMATHTVSPSKLSPPPQIPATTAKSLPIHCIVEHHGCPPGERGSGGGGGGNSSDVDLDTYAILPSSTLFSEIVRTALTKLGYTVAEAMGAKGAIQIKNWKPLTFDTITENPDATVDEILGELTSLSTLRIRLSRIRPIENVEWTDHNVRCAVIGLLKEHKQSQLAKMCPLSQPTISNIANSKYPAQIGMNKCREFGHWYIKYKKQEQEDEQAFADNSTKDIRVTFHPTYEIPKMREWYNLNKTPSDQLLKEFVSDLNDGHIRKERPKVSTAKLKIWWKNERQREKRIQQRQMEKDLVQELAEQSHTSQADMVNVQVGPNDPLMGARSPPRHVFQSPPHYHQLTPHLRLLHFPPPHHPGPGDDVS